MYDSIDYQISVGLLNKDGKRDKCIRYSSEPCVNCGRMRVEIYESGMKVCEKCNVDQDTKDYVDDLYYSNY